MMSHDPFDPRSPRRPPPHPFDPAWPPPPTPGPPVGARGIEANAGVDLIDLGGRLVAHARYLDSDDSDGDGGVDPADRLAPVPFEKLSALAVAEAARVLRRLWRERQRACGCFLLYYDFRDRQWDYFLPPQMCDGDAPPPTLDLGYRRCLVPGRASRLAGSLTCCTLTDPAKLAVRTPGRDGVHLFVAAQYWGHLTAFLTVGGGTPMLAAIDRVVFDLPSDRDRPLLDRALTVRPA